MTATPLCSLATVRLPLRCRAHGAFHGLAQLMKPVLVCQHVHKAGSCSQCSHGLLHCLHPAAVHHGADGLAGADELSSEELSDLAMLAASIAARPSTLSEEDAGNEALYAASNMQRSTRLQSVFSDFKGKLNHVVVSGPSPLGSPLVQVRQ